ncbi:MAG: response regulator [Oscillospiraceae bacterium]|nr:response regulator [Oscillospiraceae bacterium]
MKILIIEDEREHCEEYIKCLEIMPFEAELMAADGYAKGLSMLETFKPDIILLDLEFSQSDGDGILFLDKIKKSNIKKLPYIIVITANISKKAHKTARQCGADYFFLKTKPDYSPYLVLEFANTYFTHQPKDGDEGSENRLENIISDELGKIGVTRGMDGKNYIVDAVMIILDLMSNKMKLNNINLGKQVYPVIARKYKKSAQTVEQGIRNAIKRAWLITDLDTLADNYTDSISIDTGYPENKSFIFYYVEKFSRVE